MKVFHFLSLAMPRDKAELAKLVGNTAENNPITISMARMLHDCFTEDEQVSDLALFWNFNTLADECITRETLSFCDGKSMPDLLAEAEELLTKRFGILGVWRDGIFTALFFEAEQ